MNHPFWIYLIVLKGFLLFGQQKTPPIHNFKITDYKASSKNWSVAFDQDNSVFVANTKGLLHYNGQKWSLYTLPNKTIVRAVAVIEDRVYTGSYEEFERASPQSIEAAYKKFKRLRGKPMW